tara:strand:- start:149 stop:778 length:630 start_codon:yes stop_codon:yes gene_type:complete
MGQRKNYHTVRYGTRDGELQFGHIHQDNNEAAVMLRSGHESLHYIQMDHTGDEVRKHSTICRSTGSFQVKAGDNAKVTKNNRKNDAGIYMDSVSGDIILRAAKGKIRIEAQDIEMVATGYNGRTGYISLDSNEKLILKSKSVDIRATETAKFFSENKLDVVGNAIMNIYGGLMDFADGATSIKGSKMGPSSTEENAKKLKRTPGPTQEN